MDKEFEKSYKDVVLNVGTVEAAYYSDEYVKEVNNAITESIKELMKNQNNREVGQLKGYIAETWHTWTYNIDNIARNFDMKSSINGITVQATQEESNKFASVDISTYWGDYGLKYYADAQSSVKQQAKSYVKYYNETIAKGNNKNFQSIEDFYEDRGKSNIDFNDSIYEGQKRIIPSDQLDEALRVLRKKIIKDIENRPEQSARYKETYNNLADRILGPNNSESMPLSEKDSRQLAQDIKDGTFSAEDYGLTLDKIIEMEYILKQSMKAAISAATITMVMMLSGSIIKLISRYLRDEKISTSDFGEFGISAISASGQAFVRGYVAALITCKIKIGAFGKVLQKNANPTIIGSIVAVMFGIIAKSFKLAGGSITQAEFGYECAKTVFISLMGIGGVAVFQSMIPIPVIGALLGNIIGCIIGAVVYDTGNMMFLSFCADMGYSFLGFVDQNYELPEYVLKDMGLDVISFDSCVQDECKPDICELDECKPDGCVPIYINTYVIKRGVIGINKVGYIIK